MKKLKQNIIIRRWNSDTPTFFLRVISICKPISLVLASIITAYIAIPEELKSLVPENMLKVIINASIIIGGITTGLGLASKLTTNDKQLTDKQDEK